MACTLILHAYRWPSRAHLDALIADARAAAGDPLTVVEAREDERAAVGAAALVNQAAASIQTGRLIVAQPCVRWTSATWQALIDTAGERPGLVLGRASSSGVNSQAADQEPPCRVWSIDVNSFNRLGGLDPQLWSVGEVADLAARAERAGVPTRSVAADGEWLGPDPYPLAPAVSEFLAIRNPLVTAFRAWPLDRLGPLLATSSARALLTSAREADAAPEAFAFGARAAQPSARAGSAATMVPLLALDSFLSMATALATERRVTASADPSLGDEPEGPVSSPALPSLIDSLQRIADDVERGSGAASVQQSFQETNGAGWRGSGTTPPYGSRLPRVSVIVVNWNGREHLETCFRSLEASDYPADRLELILLDNGSTDGSRELVAARFPRVRIVALPENQGFTGGNNAAAAAATGDVLVFFNNDMRVEPAAVRALVEAMDEDTPCTSARVLSWDGTRIDFVGGGINFEGRGFQHHFGKPLKPEFMRERRTFFPNGGAFAITRDAFESAGRFDPAYFAYYDDVDLGWRVWLTGGAIRLVPEAVVYHKHGATSGRYPSPQKQFHMHRNAIWNVLRNYEDATLARLIGPVLLLLARRVAQDARIDRGTAVAKSLAPFSQRCRRGRHAPRAVPAGAVYTAAGDAGASGRARDTAVVATRVAMEVLAAVRGAMRELPRIAGERQALQRRRVLNDATLLPHAGFALHGSSFLTSYLEAQVALAEALELDALFGQRPRLLIITHEALKPNMSGPGVRALEIGRALSDDCQVTIATLHPPEIEEPRCRLVAYSYDQPQILRALAEDSDAILVQGFTLSLFPFLTQLDLPIVVDLYCPFTLEHLEMKAGTRPANAALSAEAKQILDVQIAQLAAGDFFICASERQRDFWIGGLHAAGRINPTTYAGDRTLRRLIDVVPFGLPDISAGDSVHAATRPVLKGTHPAIGPRDRVLLWGGSLLDWQDPETLIRAVALLRARRDDVKLFFMGVRHPNPQVAPMRAVEESRSLARSLGLLDTHVIFNDWVPYAERARYLLDSDIGVSTHRDHLETRYAFRTRMLDYIWAGLPIVCTRGDYFADLVDERQLGLTVPPRDVTALAAALEAVLDDGALRARCRTGLEALRPELEWNRVVAPLRAFCRAPHHAADRAVGLSRIHKRLRNSFRFTKLVKQTALELGISEHTLEQVKRWKLVESAMSLRNRVARARAER